MEQKAFGKISASRNHSSGTMLVDSEIEHNTYITLTIKRADFTRKDVDDRYYGGESLIKVAMTSVQWAEFLTNMNTEGVPCTIEYTKQDGKIKYTPLNSRLEHSYNTFSAKLDEQAAMAEVNKLRDIVENSKMTKKDKSRFEVVSRNLVQYFKSNAKFYLKTFKEQADKIVVDGKAELEAIRLHTINELGHIKLDELKDEQKKIG